MSVSGKVKCIEGRNKKLSISRQCELLQLPRSSYYRPRDCHIEDEENLELMRLIDEEFLRHPFYGSRKMKVYLSRRGFPVNRKRVQRLMRLMGLESIAPKPNTSRQRKEHKVYPYLLKKMSITEPDQVVMLRHNLHSAGSRLCLPDCSNGLGMPLCADLGSLSDHR